MNNDLKNDLNNALNSDQFISLVINFINNASNYFYDHGYNKSQMIAASNVSTCWLETRSTTLF